MKTIVIILSCLAVTALAQFNRPSWNQPSRNQPNRRPATCSRCSDPQNPAADVPAWCPPCPDPPGEKPPPPTTCGVICDSTNRHWLWPHQDPNNFWQCQRKADGGWMAIERQCACGTLFDYGRQYCVHPIEWNPQCAGHNNNPILAECPKM